MVAPYPWTVTTHFHVSSVHNRESISKHGLDWRRMGAAPGIAGSRQPEQPGCFLVDHESDVEWFVRMNNTGGAVDVWEVNGVDVSELVESPEGGYLYLPTVVPNRQLRLVQRDLLLTGF